MSPEAQELFLEEVYPDTINRTAEDEARGQQIYALDYLRQPVDVITFVRDDYFLGRILTDNGRSSVYPKILDDLQELFNGDYVEVLLKGSIGWGKTTFAYIGILYDLYCVSCLRNPAGAYGLIPGTSLAFVNVSTTLKLAQRVLFKGIFNLIRSTPYFKENFPFDPNLTNEARFPRGVVAYPVATNEQSMLGEGVFSAAIDEINFYKVVERSKNMPEGGLYDQAQVLYNRISRRLRSRMNQRGRMPGHLYMISSSRYPNDFTERKSNEARGGDKAIFRKNG